MATKMEEDQIMKIDAEYLADTLRDSIQGNPPNHNQTESN